MKLLSVIVPCYNEEDNVFPFYEELMKNKEFFDKRGLDIEIIYINDGSKDETVNRVKELHEKDERVKLVSFSRNFGKESAIYAGFKKAKGDYVVMMDADLQDPPALLPEMFGYIDEGYDSVATRRVNRKGEPPIRSFFARMFYRLINKMSKTEIVDGARDYRLMTRQVTDSILSMCEYNRFSKGIYGWVGYETKWSFWGLFKYSLEGIVAFTTAPLSLASFMGVLFCFFAFILIIFIIIRTCVFGDPTSGWPSLVCIISLISGVQLLCLGIMGQYLSRTYLEVKKRPLYFVKEEID